MFEDLSKRFDDALKTLRGEDRITETNITGAIKAVKTALLDADVNLSVVNDFLEDIRTEAIGAEVVRGIKPEQKFVEIVNRKLIDLMGGKSETLSISGDIPSVILLVGLQGAGKTTAAAKLALYLKEQGGKVLLVAADTFRPAAKDQLKTLGSQIGVDVFSGSDDQKSGQIAMDGIQCAIDNDFERVIIDTAGRLYIDEELMKEIKEIKIQTKPQEVLLVVDSMMGQDAADLTRTFDDAVGITGAILTKMDGDARGGAALSVRKVSGKPIKFIGTGEKVEALDPFYPDRIASRILGMGDILTLVDKAQKEVELEDVMVMQRKFEEATFDFNDFLKQMKLIKRMGSIGGLMKLIPGMNRIDDKTLKAGEVQLKKIESMIGSMTIEERKKPSVLIKSQQRRKRIAAGSGHVESEVNKVISDFERMRQMMQGLAKGDMPGFPGSLPKDMSAYQAGTSHAGQRTGKKAAHKEAKKKKGFFEL